VKDRMGLEPDDKRAEDALRYTLARDRGWNAARIDGEAVRRRARRRARVRIAGAALAVVVVAGGVAAGVEIGSGGANDSIGPTATLPPPDDGWRWDFYRDIRIQVPDSWDYGSEPGSDWCIYEAQLPQTPYIDLDAGGFTAGVGCPSTNGKPGLSDEPPTDLWATHVRLTPLGTDRDASVSQLDGWWSIQQPVGHVLVKAVGKDREFLDRIVASATEVTDNTGGCAPHSRVQDSLFPRPDPAFDVSKLTSVDSITVCSYALTPDEPGLLGSFTMSGSAAARELQALQAAPVGGGPDQPQNCMADDPGDSALQLLLDTGDDVYAMYVYYSSCRGNGFDDGTTLRELTRAACVPLVHEPVVLTSGASASFERCYSRPVAD
jgi:hypothetical protein